MKMRKILKCTALTMAIVMIFSTAAIAGTHCHYHHHHHGGRAWYNTGWGVAAIGAGVGLLVGAIASSSRQERRQDPGEYRQDPGEYRQDPGMYRRDPGYAPSPQARPQRDVELAESVPGGVMINGQFYAPAEQSAPNDGYSYYNGAPYGYGSGMYMYNTPYRRDPGRARPEDSKN